MLTPIAAADPLAAAGLIACGMMGLSATLLVWWLLRVLRSDDIEQGAEWRYDVSRINELRRADPLFRLLQPAVQRLARVNRVVLRDALPEIQRHIHAAGLSRFWLAEEYLAKLEILALLLLPAYAYVFVNWIGLMGLPVAALAVLATVWMLRRRLASRAAKRLTEIKRRMPFLLDLLTLLMEAGATFLRAIDEAVGEFRGHPVAEEFGRVLADIKLGKTRQEAFRALRDRLADDEITSIVGSILQGEQLGTPLARVFRTQADVLRLKRSQRAETLASEAGVNMLLPAVLVMAATVLIILGPFLLNFLTLGLAL